MKKNVDRKSWLREATAGLKALFSAAKMMFSQFEDADGNVYQYSELVVGAEVFKASGDGSEPAPDGEYQVDELTKIVVKNGVIEEVISDAPVDQVEEVMEEVVPEEPAVDSFDMAAFVEQVTKSFEDLMSRVSNLESKVSELSGEVDNNSSDVNTIAEGFNKLLKLPISLSKLPKSGQKEKKPQFEGIPDSELTKIREAFRKKKNN